VSEIQIIQQATQSPIGKCFESVAIAVKHIYTNKTNHPGNNPLKTKYYNYEKK
jgi:hypothetical protein